VAFVAFFPVSRYVRAICAPAVGVEWANDALLEALLPYLQMLPLAASERLSLENFVRLLLIGLRTRRILCPDFLELRSFSDHAAAFEAAVTEALQALRRELDQAGVPAVFDAVIAISSTGNLLPGMADRLAEAWPDRVAPEALLLDVSNGGCTSGARGLRLASRLGPEYKNVLLAVVEVPTSLTDPCSTDRANWQGLCTFGDGAAAVWLSDEPAPGALEVDQVYSWHSGLSDLIRWQYGSSYYRFDVSDLGGFEQKVRNAVFASIGHFGWERGQADAWALHPAGMMLLLSLAKKLGIERQELEPSIRHFRKFSNMSGASLLHIMRDLWISNAKEVRWLAMGAGFHVEAGRGKVVE
jgi:alkylresorcinol/alkylpyrone synthase